MISSFTETEDLAKTFLLDYLDTEELQLALYEAGGRPPAMTSAFEQVSTDPIIAGFGLSGSRASRSRPSRRWQRCGTTGTTPTA